jgi:biotin-[acetyl-CoA-carboxylase] ligase BirA-like protein
LWKLYISKKKNLKYLSDLINLIQKDSIFKEFYYFDKISSTQDLAFKIIKKKKIIRPSVIICNSQTMGKGRNSSVWSSKKGGIWVSLILETNMKVEKLFMFMMISSICICETIEQKTNLKPTLKWPNDIFINGKKVAGILLDIESDMDNNKNNIILGMGINTNNDLNSILHEIQVNKKPSYYNITTLKKELNDIQISNMDFLSKLLDNINTFLLKINTNPFLYECVFKSYKERIMNSKNSLQYVFKNDNIVLNGELVDLAHDGSLLVKDLQQNKIINISSANNVELK